MKIRTSFISNSSSASFLLFKPYMTRDQINQVGNWQTFCLSDEYKVMLEEYAKTHPIEGHANEWCNKAAEPFSLDDFPYYPEGWSVQETNDVFEISTDMDNFNMEQYLNVLGIDIDKMGMWIEDHHDFVLGLNNARTDLKDYFTDPYYFEHWDEEYWLTSEDYKERVYKTWVETNKKQLEENPKVEDHLFWPRKPIEKKIWICQDAGQALNEVESKIKELARKNGVFYTGTDSEGQYLNEKTKLYAEVLDVLNEVKDNWKARDDFED